MSESTSTPAYTERLVSLEALWWKRLIPVQLPYRLHLKSLKPKFMLEVGCGIGGNYAILMDTVLELTIIETLSR